MHEEDAVIEDFIAVDPHTRVYARMVSTTLQTLLRKMEAGYIISTWSIKTFNNRHVCSEMEDRTQYIIWPPTIYH